jgi:hypothetical protein
MNMNSQTIVPNVKPKRDVNAENRDPVFGLLPETNFVSSSVNRNPPGVPRKPKRKPLTNITNF